MHLRYLLFLALLGDPSLCAPGMLQLHAQITRLHFLRSPAKIVLKVLLVHRPVCKVRHRGLQSQAKHHMVQVLDIRAHSSPDLSLWLALLSCLLNSHSRHKVLKVTSKDRRLSRIGSNLLKISVSQANGNREECHRITEQLHLYRNNNSQLARPCNLGIHRLKRNMARATNNDRLAQRNQI